MGTREAPVAAQFPAIADYAFLSDCEVNALVAPDGAVEWLCLPRPDAPSTFGALLDRGAGTFRLGPAHLRVPSQRRYLPGTMVLETTWHTSRGWMVVRDALVMEPWRGHERVDPWRRPPGDAAAAGVLLRYATCLGGVAELQFNCLPLFDYGQVPGSWAYLGDGYLAATCEPQGRGVDLTLTSSVRLVVEGPRVLGRAQIQAGESAFAALAWNGQAPNSVEEAAEALGATTHAWRAWLGEARLPDHPWRPYLERSALTLKGLTYAPTGAVLAAATTSLPETPGGERNWDYRYSWIRDSALMLRALFGLGFDWEGYQYAAFLKEALASGPLQVMYAIDGARDLPERTLDHLSGYGGARPVRIGNNAYKQQQHDVWGMLADGLSTEIAQGSLLGPAEWNMIVGLVDEALKRSSQPDRGIWEIRGTPQHFTASKVMCWVAADRGVRLAEDRGDTRHATAWRKAAGDLRDQVCAKAVDERGVFVAHYGAKHLDASVLLIPIMGFLPPDDPRVRATTLAIADELTRDGLVLRYEVDDTDDGLHGQEGTFTICSFWLVSALCVIGELGRAKSLCEKLLALATPLQLYAEELDASSGRHLGNFPQAFTHLSLIDAVSRIIHAEGG